MSTRAMGTGHNACLSLPCPLSPCPLSPLVVWESVVWVWVGVCGLWVGVCDLGLPDRTEARPPGSFQLNAARTEARSSIFEQIRLELLALGAGIRLPRSPDPQVFCADCIREPLITGHFCCALHFSATYRLGLGRHSVSIVSTNALSSGHLSIATERSSPARIRPASRAFT